MIIFDLYLLLHAVIISYGSNLVKMNEDYVDLGVIELAATHYQQPHPDSNDASFDSSSSSIRLLQLTDLHIFPKECPAFLGISLGDSYHQCMQLIARMVNTSQPDVIILTGDIIDGRGPWGSKDRVTEALTDMIPHFNGRPWLYLPGNHDDDHSPWTRQDLLQLHDLPGCLQKDAKGFHHTMLLSKTTTTATELTTTKVRLHLFDSGGNHPDPKVSYYCTPQRTVQAFSQWTADEAKSKDHDNNVTALVYFHIPTPEYEDNDPVVGQNYLFEAALVGGKVPSPWNQIPWFVRLIKKNRVAGCTRGPDTGLFDAFVDANARHEANIIGMFCGHDHHSDAIFRRAGLFLGYGRSGSFTPPYDWERKAPNPLLRGARVVQVASDGTTTTWTMNERDGMEVDSVFDMSNYEEPKGWLYCE